MESKDLKFVIDPRCFDGCCVTSMSDGVHNDYGDSETLEELRTRENNPFLTTVPGNTIRKMTRIHERGLCAPFREIPKTNITTSWTSCPLSGTQGISFS